LVVLPDGGGFGDGGVEDLPHKLAEVESLLGGVNRIEIEIEIVYNNTSINRLLSLGPPVQRQFFMDL
jgi:hypothetical protein